MRKYQQILIPDWLGNSIKNGVHKGPKALREAILSTELKTYFVEEAIEIEIPAPNPEHVKGEFEKVKYWPEIKQICQETKKEIIKIIDNQIIPVVFLGDDSSLMGVLSGIANKYANDFGLVYFDAHADINTPETTLTGRIFGMPLSHLLGFGNEKLIELNGNKPSLKAENILMLGTRSIDPGEAIFIKKHKIELFDPDKVNNSSSEDITDEILKKFGDRKIFVHIDVDVIDPEESKATWTPVTNGIKANKLKDIVSILAKKGDVIGFCVSEYNPRFDVDDKTKKIILDVLEGYIKNNIKSNSD